MPVPVARDAQEAPERCTPAFRHHPHRDLTAARSLQSNPATPVPCLGSEHARSSSLSPLRLEPSPNFVQTLAPANLMAAEPPSPSRSLPRAQTAYFFCIQWITHGVRSIPDPRSLRFCPGTPDSGAPVRFFPTRRRGEEFPGNPRRRCSRDGPEPFDREPAPPIRSSALKTQAIRSGSNGPDLRVPLRPGSFSKETLIFCQINPQPRLIQK